jgi:hypothetical protein
MSDGTALIWGLAPQGWQPPKGRLAASELDALWAALAGESAPAAYAAVCTLCASPADGITLLKARLTPIAAEKPERICRLVADLDSEDFGTRETATKEVARLGVQAEAELQKALAMAPSAEVRNRVEPLLKALEGWVVKDPETLRRIRAVWVLERIGTPEARALLEKVAEGAPAARPTQDARAALMRLKCQPPR